MRLVVLGGASAGPNAGQGCSGYLVEDGDTRVVLDLGPGTLLELRRHTDFRTLDAVVLTHLHIDHMADVIALCWALAHNPVRPPRPLPLWLPPDGTQLFTALAAAFAAYSDAGDAFERVFEIREYDPEGLLRIGQLQLTFTPTKHYLPCWAIRVSGPTGRDLVYTGDAGPGSGLERFAAGANTLVAEAMLLERGNGQYGGSTAAEAAQVALDAEVEVLVLTHLWEERGIERYREQAATVFPRRLEVARPGLTVAW
jgi:ribonuclease BN (tRNA processing enzyme)